MANTVNQLTYANTFGDWMVATDALINENNTLGKSNYTKDTGTLTLNETTKNALLANGVAVFQNQLLSQGTGSSVTIQNNLTVSQGQVYFSNTTLGLTNAGQANINGLLIAQAPGLGLSVSNNAFVGGNTTIVYNTTTNNLQANSSVVTNGLVANTTIYTNTVHANSAVYGDDMYANTLQVQDQFTVQGNFVLNGDTVYNSNNFTINSGSGVGLNSTFTVNRGTSGNNASIRWNEFNTQWDMTRGGSYYRVLTDEYFNDTIVSQSTTAVATANAVYTVAVHSNSAFTRANTSLNLLNLTTGSVSPSSGVITITSNNGVTLVATSSNTLALSTSQDLRTSSSPTFAGLTLTTPLGIGQGGTNATTATQAITNLLPTGTTAGYVLTTGGPGNFYWSASGGSGSGAVPGTTISSSRLSYTANGAAGFTGNTFTIPVALQNNQVRTYIDGVRQFESEYNLNLNANTISFLTTPDSGNKILIEVDGYIVNPYYANNITFTAPQGSIPSSANTIQLAINDLESRKAALTGASFTGVTTGLTHPATTSNTAFATTAYVQSLANSSGTLTTSITGNSGTVTNGVYTSGSYSDPSWLTISKARVGLGNVANTDTSNASNISAGTLDMARLGTSGNPQFNSLGVGTAGSTTAGEIRATNNITAYYNPSDRRLKENIVPLTGALTKIDNIGAYNFNYITRPGKTLVGVIAQELLEQYPELVYETTPIDENTGLDKIYAVNYELMTVVLLQAIKELKSEVDALKGNNK